MEKNILRVRINTKDEKAFVDLVLTKHLDMAAEHREKDGTIVAEAYVPSTQIDQLHKPGVGIEVIEDANKTGRERQKQVSSVNRFALDEQPSPPRGFGKKE
jgi:hypothetical protein